MVHCIPETGFSRTYLIEAGEGLVAVDVGCKGAAKSVERYVTGTLGKHLIELSRITTTHFHIDHIGGIGYLLDWCSFATQVQFNRIVQDYLTGTRRISFLKHWFTALIPAAWGCFKYLNGGDGSNWKFGSYAGLPLPLLRKYLFSVPYKADRIEFKGGTGIARYGLGFDDWEAILTPGHTEDSLSFYSPSSQELICGDLILNLRKPWKGALNRFHWSEDHIKASFQMLQSTIKPQTIYPGHGEVIRDEMNALDDVEVF
jgi:glyoxylase-like metal-dependent hydrolase (beta-lactamase superfamily II)